MKTNPDDAHQPSSICDRDRLQRFLAGVLDAQGCTDVESHLSVCEACRFTLDSMASTESFRNALTNALNTTSSLSEQSIPIIESLADSFRRNARDGDARHPFESNGESQYSLENWLRDWLGSASGDSLLGQIGRYDVQSVLGRGGMGVVLRARDRELDRPVAIKTLFPHLHSCVENPQRLLREAKAAAGVQSPYIIPIIGTEMWRNVPCVVMPLIAGGTLEDHLRDQRPTIDEILSVAHQLALALATAHQAGLIHRDVKPSNVLLADGLKRVVLSDFGLARWLDDTALTSSERMLGTPQYMSPEQVRRETLTPSSDLFALGSLLCWMCTGQNPFSSSSYYETSKKITEETVPPVATVQPNIPGYLSLLIERLLMKRPEERWESAQQVANLVEQCRLHRIHPNEYPLPVELRSKPHARFATQWTAGMIVASLVVCVAWVGFNSWPKGDSSSILTSPAADEQKSLATFEKIERENSAPRNVRSGPLDELERRAVLVDLTKETGKEQLHYWLHRLASLNVNDIPIEVLPTIEKLTGSNDSTIQSLASQILAKDPFSFVDNSADNPFVEVKP